MSIELRFNEYFCPIKILKLKRFFERSQWFPRERLVEYQEARLREIVRHAYSNVPYYRDLFESLRLKPGDIRRVDDLSKLPVLTKELVRSEFSRLQANNMNRFHPRLIRTSGTSGEPVNIYVDKSANALEFVYYWRHWNWAGYHLGNRFAEFSSSFFLKSKEPAQRLFHFQTWTQRLFLNSLSLSLSNVMPLTQVIRQYRPCFLKGLASVLYYFAIFLRQKGIGDINFKAVFSTGEMLIEKQRRVIEETFCCKAYDSYGHMERVVAISECPENNMHIISDYGLMEMIQEPSTGTLAKQRENIAKIIGTGLYNFSMPLLRYETGDQAELSDNSERCLCGRELPIVKRIIGRQEDVIVTPDGRVVSTLFLILNEVPGLAMGQITQESMDKLSVAIVREPDYTDDSEKMLLDKMRTFVGTDMQIDIEYLAHEELKSRNAGKFKTIVSKLKRSDRESVS